MIKLTDESCLLVSSYICWNIEIESAKHNEVCFYIRLDDLMMFLLQNLQGLF